MEENEWQKSMKGLILNIDAQIGEHLSKGHTPVAIIAQDSALKQIEEYLRVQIDWNNPVILFGDDQIELRIIRTVDIKRNQVWIV